jgi:Zn finger protein HypA/HybF involved in hydrogenase expression
MHEMGIASSVIEAVHREMLGYPSHRAVRIGLRIGEFAGIDRESLCFSFEALIKNTEFERLHLEIESCRAADGRRGDELEIAYLDLEDEKEK